MSTALSLPVELTEVLEASLVRHDLSGARLLFAVSGGSDSVGLLRAAKEWARGAERQALVGHVNHGLRGGVCDADAAWVEALCASVGLESEVVQVSLAVASSEGAAREARYRALEGLADEHGCQAVVTAHTSDDQVDTVLHHVIRGAGMAGLSGMSELGRTPAGKVLVRPFLSVSREGIRKWLVERGQEWREDASNADTGFTRNRIRHELLPLLERDFNPRVREALLRVSRLASDTMAATLSTAEMLWEASVVERSQSRVRVRCDVLGTVNEVQVREVLRWGWRQQRWPEQAMGFDHWCRLAEVVGGERTAVDCPGGVTARRQGGVMRLDRETRSGD